MEEQGVTPMDRRSFLISTAFLTMGSAPALADYPERPITMVTGWAPGGSTDIVARLLGDQLKKHLSERTVTVVDSKPGNSGGTATDWLRRQPADGYTLMLGDSGANAILPTMQASGTRYHPVDDFTQVATIATSPMVLIVSPEFPAKTAREALEVLRSPASEQLNSANAGIGSPTHIAAHLLQITLGPTAKSQPVPYRSGSQMTLSIAKNETSWGVASLGSAAGMITGGQVRALAITETERFPSFPDVPTLAEDALPGFTFRVSFQMHAPPAMPPDILQRLNRAFATMLTDDELKTRFLALGIRAWAGPNTPADARRFVEEELAKFKKIAELTGIKI